jgi:NADP-reducing hydrogenase subunit HndB
MPQLKSVEDLNHLRKTVQNDLAAKRTENIIITVGMGTCGQAAGAGETFHAIKNELSKRNIIAELRSVGCIGMCVKEPLVDIQLPGESRVTYANVTPAQVSRLMEEHILGGQVIEEWAIGILPAEW